MLKATEMTSPTSCLNKAREDELIFVLLERDPAATVAVQAWIDERIRIGRNKPDDEKIAEAKGWIRQVEALRK